MELRDEALQMRLDIHGILETRCKYPLNNGHDLAVAYTPCVAEP